VRPPKAHSAKVLRLGIVERARLGFTFAAQLGVGMLMGAMVGPWARLGGDDFSDSHHKPLLAWPGVAKSPGAICKYSTMRFCALGFFPAKGIWGQISLDRISGRHPIRPAPLQLGLTVDLQLA
jgi:hypothetical protein